MVGGPPTTTTTTTTTTTNTQPPCDPSSSSPPSQCIAPQHRHNVSSFPFRLVERAVPARSDKNATENLLSTLLSRHMLNSTDPKAAFELLATVPLRVQVTKHVVEALGKVRLRFYLFLTSQFVWVPACPVWWGGDFDVPLLPKI